MTRAFHHRKRAAVVAGYTAAARALLFAVPHLSWGVGGAVGLDTALTREIVAHRSGWFLALNWGIGLFCLAGGWSHWPRSIPEIAGCPPDSCAAWPGSGSCCWQPAS